MGEKLPVSLAKLPLRLRGPSCKRKERGFLMPLQGKPAYHLLSYMPLHSKKAGRANKHLQRLPRDCIDTKDLELRAGLDS